METEDTGNATYSNAPCFLLSYSLSARAFCTLASMVKLLISELGANRGAEVSGTSTVYSAVYCYGRR